jgi:hypothetical protein
MTKLVLIESPYRGKGYTSLELNLKYARACMRDSILRGESPFASHLLYTQEGILDDKNSEERKRGMQAGWAWGEHADLSATYLDLIDDWQHFVGIAQGVVRARHVQRPVEFRNLSNEVLNSLDPQILTWRRNPQEIIGELEPYIEANRADWEKILFP